MISLQVGADLATHGPEVNGIVRVVVAQISNDEKAEKGLNPGMRKDKPKTDVEECHQKYGTSRRHDEARAVIRVIMMYAVKEINQILASL